jgi:AcrR family transcriptional regulator
MAGREWFCEVATEGRVAGGLPLDENGLGVLIGRLICDSVEVEHGNGRDVVRFVFGGSAAGPRQLILAAGAELFARDGVRATGVNAIITRAGVAKGTFYAHFPSKNDLVLAWLQSSPVDWFNGVRAEIEARAATPAERLALFFGVLGEWLAADELHGCQTLNAAAEARFADPARHSLAELQDEIEGYLRNAARDCGIDDPDRLAAQLLLLVEGAIVAAAAHGSAEPAATAQLAASRLVAAGDPD